MTDLPDFPLTEAVANETYDPAAAPAVMDSDDAAQAIEAISGWDGYAPTRLVTLGALVAAFDVGSVFYKDEGGRFGLGSFKALGGAYAIERLMQDPEFSKDDPVFTTATDGNHGRSVAWGAARIGAKAVIYIPANCSAGREAAIRSYGADVIRTNIGYDETVRQCAADAEVHGRIVVSDTSWDDYETIPRDIMHGYAILLDEALNQMLPDAPTHVFVQGGVGAYPAAIAGCLKHYFGPKELPRLICVEPDGAACLLRSAKACEPVAAPPPVESAMAGLECGEPSPLAWRELTISATAFLSISDDAVAPWMRFLADGAAGMAPIVAGESAIAGLAGFAAAARDNYIRGRLGIDVHSCILAIGTEGATDPDIYRQITGRDPARVAAS